MTRNVHFKQHPGDKTLLSKARLWKKPDCRSRKKDHNMCGIGLEGIKRIFKGVGIAPQLRPDMSRQLGNQGYCGLVGHSCTSSGVF